MQNSEPNIRLAAFKLGSTSTADDDKQALGKPGARPVATKGQPKSTTGVSSGQITYHSHRQSLEHQEVTQSTPFHNQNASAFGEQSGMPKVQSATQSEGRPGDDFANGLSGSSSKFLSGQSAVVTITNAQGNQVVHTVPAAVIRVPVRTTNSEGRTIITEGLSTAAATASINDVITSIYGPGSTVLRTSQVPAIEYTITNSEGSTVIVKSAVVPSSPASATRQNYASPEEGRPGSPSEGRPQPNASEGDQAGQLDSAQNGNSVGSQGYQQSPPEPGSGSGSSTITSSQAFDQSSSASATYNAFDVKVGSEYDQLVNSGPAAVAENPGALAQFVQDRLANQTNEQKQEFKSQINSQFAKFVDDLFAAPASVGQPDSQQTAAQQPGSQSPQDLANETCSSLGEMHEQLITNVFFMETTISTIFWQYTNVRDVFVKQCQ